MKTYQTGTYWAIYSMPEAADAHWQAAIEVPTYGKGSGMFKVPY